jgi:DNA polymerase-1
LDRAGIVTEWVYTEPTKNHPEGQRSVAKKNMTVDMFRDKKVAAVLGYRNRLGTCLGTFMKPWATVANQSGGLIYTKWNQVRGGDEGGMVGARTGRLSSSPNFQNIPKNFADKDDGYVHPTVIDVQELPLMRQYILPDKGEVLGHRDYNQQELRILGHFEDDTLCAAYNENPRMDVHTFVQGAIKEILGLEINRSSTKILNFGMIYGMGLGKLADDTHTTVEEAKRLKQAQMAAIPGLKELTKVINKRGRDGEAIRTWGGREYYCEPPKTVNGRFMTFEYKLLNYLIQGSAADCSKQSIINYHIIRKEGRFLLTVHDENNLSIPKKAVKQEMALLREAMESVKFDVPMLSDGKTGPRWSQLVAFKE